MADLKRSDNEENQKAVEEGVTLLVIYFLLLVLGFVLFVVGISVLLIASVLYGGGSASGGAVVFIGPFLIVIGEVRDVTWIVLFSTILIGLSVVAFLVMNRKTRRNE